MRVADDLSALGRLALVSRRRAASDLPGGRTGGKAGHSTDFMDYRRLNPGDDVRYVDWALFSRLGKLYSRTFHAEADLNVHLLLDASASMGLGAPEKLGYAKRVATALSYVGLRRLDLVALATFSDGVDRVLPPRRSRRQLLDIVETLSETEARGRTDFTKALRGYGAGVRGSGLFIVVSDFFAPDGISEGLRFLRYKGFEVALIQVLAPEEAEPALAEDVELEDAEDPALPRVRAGAWALSRYRENLKGFQNSLASFCSRHRMTYVRLLTSQPFEELLLALLDGGVWERR